VLFFPSFFEYSGEPMTAALRLGIGAEEMRGGIYGLRIG
jgi:hypothetical protein